MSDYCLRYALATQGGEGRQSCFFAVKISPRSSPVLFNRRSKAAFVSLNSTCGHVFHRLFILSVDRNGMLVAEKITYPRFSILRKNSFICFATLLKNVS